MQKVLVAVAAYVGMANGQLGGAAHVADCFTDVACPPDATGAEALAMTKCISDCEAAAAKSDNPLDAGLCGAPLVDFTAKCLGGAVGAADGDVAADVTTKAADVTTEAASSEGGAAAASATLPSVLAFTVGAAVAGMM